MPWPPRMPSREEVAQEDLRVYDVTIARALSKGAKDPGYYGRMMLSPQVSYHLSELGRIFRGAADRGNTYTHAQREFVDQIFAKDFGTNVVQSIHVNDALAVGVRMEAIEAIRDGCEELLNEEERQFADFIRKTISGRMDPATYEAMEARIGEVGALEYMIWVLYLQLTFRAHQAVGMPDPPQAEVDQWIADFKSGTRKVDDYRKRIK